MAFPTKPYELKFDERPNYLFVEVTTEIFSVDIAVAYLREVIAECRELNYHRVLLVGDIPEALSPARNKNVGSKLRELVFEGLKIAVVEPTLDRRQQDNYSDTASRGLGIDVKAYNAVPDARRWLLDD